MCKKFICPFCKSDNIKVENPEEDKKKLLAQLDTIKENNLPIDKNLEDLINQQLAYDPYEDDEYLERLKTKGLELICKDCGSVFYEFDDTPKASYTNISREEYKDIIKETIDELYNDNETLHTVLIDNVDKFLGNIKVYFKEYAQREAESLRNTKKVVDKLSMESKEEDSHFVM